MTEHLEARVAELERKLGALVERWNEFVNPDAGGVTRPRVAEIERRLGETIDREDMIKVIGKIVKRFQRIEKTALRYRGVWGGVATSPAYVCNDSVTHSGGLWICHRDAPGRPGDGADSGWVLAVKQGAV